MSLTINESPHPLSLSGDYLFYRVTSTQTAQTGFRFYVTVDVNGTERYAGYHYPNSNGFAIFDVSPIVDDLVTTDTHQAGDPIFDVVNDASAFKVLTSVTNSATVEVSIQEYYSDQLQGTASTDTIHLVKGYGYQYEGKYPSRDGLMEGWQTERTAVNSVITCPMLRNLMLPIPVLASTAILDDGGTAFDVNSNPQVRLYNGTTQLSGESYAMASVTDGGNHNASTTPSAGNFMSYIRVERDLLVAVDSTLTATEWDETATHIDVLKFDALSTQVGDTLRLEFVDPACKHETGVILWWNRYGGFDWLIVDSRVEKQESVDRKTRRTAVGNFDGTSVNLYTQAGSVVSYGNTSTTKVKASTVSATVEELRLARSCQRSRQVMLWYGGVWRPVVVDNVDFPLSTDGSSKLRPVTFNLSMADELRC